MSWASERLEYLSQRYSYRTILEQTGIPISTISYVVRGQRTLGSQYILNLRSFYTRSIYQELREAGLSANVARAYRWKSVSATLQYLNEARSVVEQLAMYREEQYSRFLQAQGRFISRENTLELLRSAITKSMARSPIDLGTDEGNDSPSLRHVIA